MAVRNGMVVWPWADFREAKKLAEKVRMLGINGARIHQRFLEIAYIE